MKLNTEELKILKDMLKEAELLARYNSNGTDYDRYKVLNKIWNNRYEIQTAEKGDKK